MVIRLLRNWSSHQVRTGDAELVHAAHLFRSAALIGAGDTRARSTKLRTCVLRLFQRRGRLVPEAANEMLQWSHGGGFSLNAEVRIEAHDRQGLERLLRYCARPIFASDRLSWAKPGERLIYSLPKPRPDGVF
ncbi:MAG: transposase [Candidatus Entotheonellia bacterium]